MIIKHRGIEPRIDESVYVAPTAVICGNVAVGEQVGKGAVVAVGALVHAGTKIPDGFFLAPNSIAIGDPPNIYKPGDQEAVVDAIKSIAFSKIAFGVTPLPEDRVATMTRATEIRSK